mgnify:CR=1 FL=1
MKLTIEIDIDGPALKEIPTDEGISRVLDHTACALYSAMKDRQPFYRSMHNREGQLYGHAVLKRKDD